MLVQRAFANRTGHPLAAPAARVSGAYSRGSRSASSCLHPGRPCYSYQVPLLLLLRNDTLWHSLPGNREIDDKGQIDSDRQNAATAGSVIYCDLHDTELSIAGSGTRSSNRIAGLSNAAQSEGL